MRFFTSFRMTSMAFPSLRHSLEGEGEMEGVHSDYFISPHPHPLPEGEGGGLHRLSGFLLYLRNIGNHFQTQRGLQVFGIPERAIHLLSEEG